MHAIIKTRNDRKAISDSLRKWINTRNTDQKASINAVNEALAIALGADNHNDLLEQIDRVSLDRISINDFNRLVDAISVVFNNIFDNEHFNDHFDEIAIGLVKKYDLTADQVSQVRLLIRQSAMTANMLMVLCWNTQNIHNAELLWPNFSNEMKGIIHYGAISALNEAANFLDSMTDLKKVSKKSNFITPQIKADLLQLIDESMIFSCQSSIDNYIETSDEVSEKAYQFMFDLGFYNTSNIRNTILAVMILSAYSYDLSLFRDLVIKQVSDRANAVDDDCPQCASGEPHTH